MTETRTALSAEPLLEQASAPLRLRTADAEGTTWLARLTDNPDNESRGAQLFGALRKALPSDHFLALLRTLLGSAARGEDPGIIGLATLVHVQAPGEAVLEAVREFAHLHRVVERLHRAQDRQQSLSDSERGLLEDLGRLDDMLRENFGLPRIEAGVLPHPRDIGPAGICRRAFANIERQLEERGTLSDEALSHFLKLADLELRAHALRASALAGSINPYSARHVSQVMPLLGALDTENRDMRDFLSTLAQERRASLFHEQTPALRHHLVREDSDAVLLRCAQYDDLQLLRRIFAAIERRPLPTRLLGYFVDRLYALGDALVEQRLRKQPIDLLEALLISCEHVDGAQLQLPAGQRVRDALAQASPEGIRVDGERVLVEVDPRLLRRLVLPLGLPRYQSRDDAELLDARVSVKDLIMDNLNNVSVLLGFLKNQKIVSTPGIVALVVQRCRAMNVLDTICETRNLHSGYANKDVPLELLRCPMPISLKTLRRFISVRYVNKVDLRRLAVDRSSVRREVSDEITRYLKSLN